MRQVRQELLSSPVAIFVIDGRDGVTALDRHFAQWAIKAKGTSGWIIVVNKCEAIQHGARTPLPPPCRSDEDDDADVR
jgi:predicted GTPase